MKRTLLITALILGFSVVGFSQTEERIDVVVTDKMQVSSTEYVYKVKEVSTGEDFYSFPIQAQIAVNTYVGGYVNFDYGFWDDGESFSTFDQGHVRLEEVQK